MLHRFPYSKYLCMVVGTGIMAFGLYNIHARCPISEGGVLGLSLLIHHWTGLSPGISSLILDGTAYLLAILALGLGFLADAMTCSVLYALWYALMELIGPMLPDLAEYPLAAALCGAAFVGVGCGLIVRHDCAASGDDAMALFCHRLSGLPVSLFYFISDVTVLLLSLSYIPARQIIWSLLTVCLSSMIIEILRPKE